MPVPRTRADLVAQIESSFAKLTAELDRGGPELGVLMVTASWTVEDLLVVRLWWTQRLVEWIEAGRRGEVPSLPADGYGWHDTPRLNDTIVEAAQDLDLATLRVRLEARVVHVLRTVDVLDDRALLDAGVFPWAGTWPVARWVSVNTARQYTTARTLIRKAVREAR